MHRGGGAICFIGWVWRSGGRGRKGRRWLPGMDVSRTLSCQTRAHARTELGHMCLIGASASFIPAIAWNYDATTDVLASCRSRAWVRAGRCRNIAARNLSGPIRPAKPARKLPTTHGPMLEIEERLVVAGSLISPNVAVLEEVVALFTDFVRRRSVRCDRTGVHPL